MNVHYSKFKLIGNNTVEMLGWGQPLPLPVFSCLWTSVKICNSDAQDIQLLFLYIYHMVFSQQLTFFYAVNLYLKAYIFLYVVCKSLANNLHIFLLLAISLYFPYNSIPSRPASMKGLIPCLFRLSIYLSLSSIISVYHIYYISFCLSVSVCISLSRFLFLWTFSKTREKYKVLKWYSMPGDDGARL